MTASALDRARTGASYVVAALAVVLLAVVYLRARQNEVWPKGHPWLPVAVLAVAAWLVVQPRTGAGRYVANVLAIVLPAVATIATVFMFGLW